MKLEEIDVGACNPFRDYPFKVKDDADMDMLVQSILDNGVMFPILVRPQAEIGYEIVSGHRRVFACKKAGIEKIPVRRRIAFNNAMLISIVAQSIQYLLYLRKFLSRLDKTIEAIHMQRFEYPV